MYCTKTLTLLHRVKRNISYPKPSTVGYQAYLTPGISNFNNVLTSAL